MRVVTFGELMVRLHLRFKVILTLFFYFVKVLFEHFL